MSNAENTGIGAAFQEKTRQYFEEKYGKGFVKEQIISIGATDSCTKDHKFDIVNEELKMVIECKRFTWTVSMNVPSAKIRTANEAVLYLTCLPKDKHYEKYLVMYRDYNSKKKETLAGYYYRMNKHPLGDIKVAEYDPEDPDSFKIFDDDN